MRPQALPEELVLSWVGGRKDRALFVHSRRINGILIEEIHFLDNRSKTCSAL